jgi:REP element-mobilizing transposase RayT
MPRLPRIYIKEALYFVTCRGEHAETIFKDERDYIMFLELLKKYQEQYGIKIFAYCLLPDHFHLLVELRKEPQNDAEGARTSQEISAFMRDLNNNYTKYFNGRYERKGHLFRERFKAALVEKEPYLLKMTAYIHLNPQKLGLIDDAKKYAYSSYQLYLHDEQAKNEDMQFLKGAVQEALNIVNNNYVQFVENVSEEERDYIHRKLQRGGILGSEEFIKQVRDEVKAYQDQGVVQKYEVVEKKGYKLFLLWGGIFLVLMVGAGGVYLFMSNKPDIKPALQENKTLTVEKKEFEEIQMAEWKVKLVPTKGGAESADVLSFKKGEFVSAKLNTLGYPNSSYSQTIDENGKVIWHTMQTGPEGVATWRGEIKSGRMRGILILRQTGKEPQDFSFISAE